MVVGRKLGRHLPRIASADGNDDPVPVPTPAPSVKTPSRPSVPSYNLDEPIKVTPEDRLKMGRLERRERRMREWQRELERDLPPLPKRERKYDSDNTPPHTPKTPVTPHTPNTPHGGADDVVGVRGRLRLSRDVIAPSSPAMPIPSSRMRGGLWADTQRHLLRAYEYLCHVGEAQQWIEGCLGEELGFGVVEMEEGLRNGVVLAKLVRVFQGEAVVKRIYEVRAKGRFALVLLKLSCRRRSWIFDIRIISTISSASFMRLAYQR